MKENTQAGTGVSALNGAFMLSKGKCSIHLHFAHILLGIAIIVISILLILIPQEGIVTNKNFTSAFYMFGIIGMCYGLYYIIAKNSRMIYEPTGSPVVYRQLYYDLDDENAVTGFINGKSATLPQSCTQGGIMLRTYVAQDGSMACLQACKYHDLVFEPLLAPAMLDKGKAKVMTEYIKSNN